MIGLNNMQDIFNDIDKKKISEKPRYINFLLLQIKNGFKKLNYCIFDLQM